MGVVKKLDIDGFTCRTMSGELYVQKAAPDLWGMWEGLLKGDDAIKDADEAMMQSGLEEFKQGIDYESQSEKLMKEREDMSVLASYPGDLVRELYQEADKQLMISVMNGALNTLSQIKIDEITVENTFGVTKVLHLQEPGGGETEQTDLKKRIGIKDFIGYNSEEIETTSFVVGFTDILHKPNLEEGQTLEEFLAQNSEDLHELIYGGEFEHKKYQPIKQFVSEILDSASLGVLPLIKAVTGYDFITDEELTEDERLLALAEGIISLVGLGVVAKAGSFTVKTAISLAIAEGVQQAAVSGTMVAFDKMGMSKGSGMVAGIIAGILTEAAGVSLINRYTAMKKSGMIVTVDDVIEGGKVTSQFNIDDIAPKLKTDPDTAFFWSGKTEGVGGADIASDIAKSKGGVTLESTIDTKNITMPEWDFTNPSSMDAWDLASGAYAEQVSGEVRAVIGSELRPGNIWENVELPKLMNNPNVTKITTIDPKTGIEKIIFER